MTHEELIARLEAATGPDRELDGWIYLAVKGEQGFEPPWRHKMFSDNLDEWARTGEINRVANNYKIPHFTASLDAALTLVPEGFHWSVYDTDGGTDANAQVEPPNFSTAPWNGTSKTPALAVCIAALKARAQP